MDKFACPCCGYLTLEGQPPGSYEICPICFWEDDPVQFNNPNYQSGANKVSLNQAKINFKLFGAVDEDSIKYVRKPLNSEKP
ncbi:MAG: hypothetical protein JW967_11495 [Dehalococcoidales bacterium]|nr:hypothetical protein [Dehalococcoidales bacterium]